MNLDELQSVQARERQSSDLQHLRSSFYEEVGEFIGGLTEERARAVEAADDPFSEPEVRRLSDDIETAQGTVEAIYERRVGKVVKKASIAAAGMPVEEDGLTSEEAALFDELVDRIERNRETVLSVLDGSPSVSCSVDGAGADAPEGTGGAPDAGGVRSESDAGPDAGVSAADLMGGGSDDPADEPASPDEPAGAAEEPAGGTPASGVDGDVPSVEAVPPESSPPVSGSTPTDGTADSDARPSDGISGAGTDAGPDGSGGRADAERPPADGVSAATGSQQGLRRATVRITADVGSIVGADDRDYDLTAEDVVTLPEPNADVLVGKDAAERL